MRHASRGQILIMFALFLVGLLGIVGLATDLGMAFAQRRTMQNGADAGALAGARAVARWSSSSPTSAQPEVAAMVAANKMNTEPVVALCEYVNYAEVSQGGCGATVPASATGVRVRAAEDHPTFFIRVVPGAPETIRVEAEAVAQVLRFQPNPSDAPFIVCGIGTQLEDRSPFSIFAQDGSGNVVYDDEGNPVVREEAYGVRFVIHDAQTQGPNSRVEDCDIDTSSFKGRAKQGANGSATIPGWWYGDTGTSAGPTRETVNGIDGCTNGTGSPYDCVAFLPVAVMDPPSVADGSDRKFYVVAMLPFKLEQTKANQHVGTLLKYVVNGPGDNTWCRDCGGTAVIKLAH
jgi:Flp pilus assembly protein TadG